MSDKLTPEQKEAQKILKGIENKKSTLPDKEKNILKWTPEELGAYILSETQGLSPGKKMKLARDLLKRIEKEKKLQAS